MKGKRFIRRFTAGLASFALCGTFLTGCFYDYDEMESLAEAMAEAIEEDDLEGLETYLEDALGLNDTPAGESFEESFESGFTLGKDNNSFRHGKKPAEGEASDPEPPYYLSAAACSYQDGLSESDLDRLLENEWFGVGLNIRAQLAMQDLKMTFGGRWSGFCIGLASIMALVYNGELSLNEITDSGARSFFELDPNTDRKFRSSIYYYFCSQYTDNHNCLAEPAIEIKPPFLGGWTSAEEFQSDEPISALHRNRLMKLCSKIVEDSEEGKVGILVVRYDTEEEEGSTSQVHHHDHAYLVTGYSILPFDNGNTDYMFSLYDMNLVNPNYPEGQISTFTISEDSGGFFFWPDSGMTVDNYKSITYISPRQIRKHAGADTDIDFILASSGSLSDLALSSTGPDRSGHVLVTVPYAEQFSLRDADGNTLLFDGSEFSGDLQIYSSKIVSGADGPLIMIETDRTDSLTADSVDGKIQVDLISEDSFVSVHAENADTATLVPGEGADIEGKDFTFNAFVSTEESADDAGDGLVSVSAGAESGVSLKAEGTDVRAETDGKLTGIVLKRFEGTKSYAREMEESSGGFTFSSRLDPKERLLRLIALILDRLKEMGGMAKKELMHFLPDILKKRTA